MTTSHTHRSFHTELSTAHSAQILNATEGVSFDLKYFDISCIGSTPRAILSYGKASWTDTFPKNWGDDDLPDNEEYDTPFGVMPMLTVKTAEGDSAILAESIVIDLYLAKRFNLLGDNEYEEQTIKAFYSSIHYLRERCLMRTTWTYADKRAQAWDTFLNRMLPWWIQIQEEHLGKNGSNGHYFGDKLSLADIHLVSALDHFAELPRGEEIVAKFKASALLWKVKETVEKVPEIAAWRASEGFKKVVEGGRKMYSATAFKEAEAEADKVEKKKEE